MTLTKLCPECSKVEDTLIESEDGGYNCKTCENKGRVSVEISAMDIHDKIKSHRETCTVERCGNYCEIDETFISTQDVKEIIDEIKKKVKNESKSVKR